MPSLPGDHRLPWQHRMVKSPLGRRMERAPSLAHHGGAWRIQEMDWQILGPALCRILLLDCRCPLLYQSKFGLQHQWVDWETCVWDLWRVHWIQRRHAKRIGCPSHCKGILWRKGSLHVWRLLKCQRARHKKTSHQEFIRCLLEHQKWRGWAFQDNDWGTKSTLYKQIKN